MTALSDRETGRQAQEAAEMEKELKSLAERKDMIEVCVYKHLYIHIIYRIWLSLAVGTKMTF